MSMSNRSRLVLFACGMSLVLAAGCGDDARRSAFLDALDGEDADGIGEDTATPTCAQGCQDDSACTADRCADDGVTCLHEFDPALCCTDDQCEIDGVCHDNLEANLDNPCQVCLVVVASDAWSADDTASCDDGSACTIGDACVDGACVGDAVVCDDGNPCTDDLCDPASGGCSTTDNTALCDDGDLCTDGDVCSAGACTPGTAITCDDANGCTDDSCDPLAGCVFAPNDGATCDDNDVCSTVDVCQGGACVASETDTCDDQDFCTADFCDSADGCGHRDLSDLCVDSNPCTDETCDPAQGCVYPFNTDPCNDGNLCTAGDVCTAGACIGVGVDPDDGNPCTDDTCDPAAGVSHAANTLPCDDNDACTVGDICAGGACLPGTQPLACDDDNACTADSCDAATGCVNVDISSTCDDGNACTVDACDPATGCANTVIQSFACRPSIVVNFPPRAATLTNNGTVIVTVTGVVTSGAGPITSLTLNGQSVSVASDGSFAFDFDAHVGSNVLSFLAEDVLGTQEERVQSFHLSSDYTLPNALTPGNDPVDPGLGIWFAQETFDDGQAPPPTDFAAIFEAVFASIDVGSFIDPTTPIANQQGYDIYIRGICAGGTCMAGGAACTANADCPAMVFGDTDVSLQAIDGGLHITASLLNIVGSLRMVCVNGNFGNLWCALGNSNGTITIDYVTINADLMISVRPDHTLQVTSMNVVTTVDGTPTISLTNGGLNFLVGLIWPFVRDGVVADLRTTLNDQIANQIGPMLESAFSALAFNQSFDLPRLDGATDAGGNPIVITVDLQSDFSYTDFQDANPGPQGGVFGLRAWATTPLRGVPAGYPFDANLGVPMRTKCGAGVQVMVVPRVAPMEIVFPDDTLNQILRAAWWGGLLEFPIDASLLGSVDLSSYGITNLDMTVSGWLPPLSSDCGALGDLRLYIGDMRIDASMQLFGQQLDMIVYVAFEAPIALQAANGEITITVQAVENVQIETNIVQENMLGSEAVIRDLLANQLVPALGGLLGGGQPLTSFPLPEIDLSSALSQPPGTTVIRIQTVINPAWDPRQDGNTVVYGQLQ